MSDKYFENFPNIYYNDVLCKDITRRAVITAANSSQPFEYYPFEITNHLRSDHIAEYYYGEGMLEWMVQIANENIDPYYGWYNTHETFLESIKEKYGTLEIAQQKVKHYINNWADDDTILTKVYYENTLAQELRKYWEPIYAKNLTITGYRRKPDDIFQNTNQIWHYEVQSNSSNVAFEIGELVDIKATGTDTRIGSGEVDTANSTMFRIKNVSGDFTANTTDVKDFVGENTGANISSANGQIWFYNIANTDFVYYTPVTYWDWELEENEKRKNIQLVGDAVSSEVANEFERLMKLDVDPVTGLSTG